jgi:hypothetical protein
VHRCLSSSRLHPLLLTPPEQRPRPCHSSDQTKHPLLLLLLLLLLLQKTMNRLLRLPLLSAEWLQLCECPLLLLLSHGALRLRRCPHRMRQQPLPQLARLC